MVFTVTTVMMVMTVMGRYFHHDLRLHRIRYCEAEEEERSEDNLFHIDSMTYFLVIYRATLTCQHKLRFLRASAHDLCFIL